MSTVIIEHVNVADLPETWRVRLPAPHAANAPSRAPECARGARTNTLVSALFWPHGAPRRLLNAARARLFELCCSPVLMAELLDLVSRAKFTGRLAEVGLTPLEIVGDKLRAQRPELVKQMGEERLVDLRGLAEAYWFLHQQPPRAWSFELDMRSKSEPW